MTTKLDRIKAAAELLATNPQEAYHSGVMDELAKEGIPALLAAVDAAKARRLALEHLMDGCYPLMREQEELDKADEAEEAAWSKLEEEE